MAKLYYYYSTMNSNKSGLLLSNAYNYESQGKRVLLLKPSLDSRSRTGYIESRSGVPPRKAIEFTSENNLFDIVKGKSLDAILIDEINFATKDHIKQLVKIVDELDINVICYGLKNSYIDGKMFDSVQELLYQCNAMYEIKSTCQWCNSKATHNLRVSNGKAVYNGEQNIVGDVVGEERYISCCRRHYYNPII